MKKLKNHLTILAMLMLLVSGCDQFGGDDDKPSADRVAIATVTTPSGTQSDDVTIQYTLTDPDQNPSDIIVQYSVDGGLNWNPASMSDNCTDGKTDLATSKSGTAHAFVWDSFADIVGFIEPENSVRIKIIPFSKTMGVEGTTNNFTVFNGEEEVNTPPAVEVTSASGNSGDILIYYKLYDLDQDNCSIEVSYSTDNSTSWHSATQGASGDGTAGLSSNSSGFPHCFSWDSISDNVALSGAVNNVIVMITPSDDELGESDVSDSFSVNNLTAPDTPSNITPGDGSTGIPTAVVLDWDNSARAEKYYVFFGTSPSPSYNSSVTDSSFDPGSLSNFTTYYYSIIAYNSAGNSSSLEGSFRTIIEAPAAITGITPADNSTNISTAATLDWDDSARAEGYYIFFGINPDPAYSGTTSASTYDPGALSFDTTYYFKILAYNEGGNTSSAVVEFRTEADIVNTLLSDCKLILKVETGASVNTSEIAGDTVNFPGAIISGNYTLYNRNLIDLLPETSSSNGYVGERPSTLPLTIAVNPLGDFYIFSLSSLENDALYIFAYHTTVIYGFENYRGFDGSYLDCSVYMVPLNSYISLDIRHGLLAKSFRTEFVLINDEGYISSGPVDYYDLYNKTYSLKSGFNKKIISSHSSIFHNQFDTGAPIEQTPSRQAMNNKWSPAANNPDQNITLHRSFNIHYENVNSSCVFIWSRTDNGMTGSSVIDNISDDCPDYSASGSGWSVEYDNTASTYAARNTACNTGSVVLCNQFPTHSSMDINTTWSISRTYFAMAVFGDGIYFDNCQESPSPGDDNNPSPMILTIYPGWNYVGPEPVDNINIVNGSDNTSIVTDLAWESVNSADGYYVFFGTSPNPSFVGTETASSYDPGTLLPNTTYYWHVVAYNSEGNSSYSNWSFVTEDVEFEIITNILPDGMWDNAYDSTVIAQYGVEPYTFELDCSVYPGVLPGGLSLASDGSITGYPTESGKFPFIVKCTDSSATPQVAYKALSITIGNSGYVFEETWESGTIDSGKWKSFGSPSSFLQTSGHDGSNYSIDTNGDGMYDSGVISYQEFQWLPGCVYSAWMKVTTSAQAEWHVARICIAREDPSTFSDTSPDRLVELYWVYSTNTQWVCAQAWNGSQMVNYRREDSHFIDFDKWHHFAIEFTASDTIKFLIDGKLFAETDNSVDLSRGYGAIVAMGRSDVDPHYIDDIRVSYGYRPCKFGQEMPEGRGVPAACSLNNKIYLIAGNEPVGWCKKQCWEYSSASNIWSSKASLIQADRYGARAVILDDKIYCIGGGDGNSQVQYDFLEQFSPENNTWTSKTSLPTCAWLPGAFEVSGKLYVICGMADDTRHDLVQIYNPENDSWTQGTPCPKKLLSPCGAVVNNNIYIMGGSDEFDDISNSTYMYNTSFDAWTQCADMPISRAGAGACQINGIIYVSNGKTTGGAHLNTMDAYCPETDSWVNKINLETLREGRGVTSLNKKIYVCGDFGASGIGLKTTEIYDPMVYFFEETWETGVIDSAKWKTIGSPTPLLQSEGFDNSQYSLDTNGDSSYDSGLVSYQEFPWLTGMVLSARIKVTENTSAEWDVTTIRLCRSDASSVSQTSIPMLGEICWAYDTNENRLSCAFYNGSSGITLRTENRSYIEIGEWHLFEIEITEENTLRYWIDGELFAESDNSVDLSRGYGSIAVHGRSYHEPHYMDNIRVYYGGTGYDATEIELFNNDFDDGTAQGWGFRDLSGLSTEQAHSGSYSIKVDDDTSSGDMSECYKTFSESISSGRIDLWAYVPSGNSKGLGISLTDESTWQKYPNHRYFINIDVDGKIMWCNSSDLYESFTPEAYLPLDSWTKISLEWNTSQETMELYINGVSHGKAYARNSGNAIRQVLFQSNDWASTGIYGYFDDVKVSKLKE